jgi:hypothetical protein
MLAAEPRPVLDDAGGGRGVGATSPAAGAGRILNVGSLLAPGLGIADMRLLADWEESMAHAKCRRLCRSDHTTVRATRIGLGCVALGDLSRCISHHVEVELCMKRSGYATMW